MNSKTTAAWSHASPLLAKPTVAATITGATVGTGGAVVGGALTGLGATTTGTAFTTAATTAAGVIPVIGTSAAIGAVALAGGTASLVSTVTGNVIAAAPVAVPIVVVGLVGAAVWKALRN